MKATFLMGAEAAKMAFGEGSVCGRIIIHDWTSDDPMVNFVCLKARRLHTYQLRLGNPDVACVCGPIDA